MIILLPPSEAKRAAQAGRPAINFPELSFPELTEARERVTQVLSQVSAQPDALQILKVGQSLQAEVEHNIKLLSQPAQPAHRVYSGVLFEALDYASLTPGQKRAAEKSVLIISALWGALRLQDCIPSYRLTMSTRLADCGNLATFWRGELEPVLTPYSSKQIIIDCRSSTYLKAWQPAPERTVQIRVVREDPSGSQKVVSHMAKHYRGLLVRYLLAHQLHTINSVKEFCQALANDWRFNFKPAEPGAAAQLTLIIPSP